jgi:hypothetical protein
MISINRLRNRKSGFEVNEWICDSGAFTELSRFGHYRHSVQSYAEDIGHQTMVEVRQPPGGCLARLDE